MPRQLRVLPRQVGRPRYQHRDRLAPLNRQGSNGAAPALAWPSEAPNRRTLVMPPDSIQPIQEILNRWILIGQALVGSIGALAFVVAFLWKMLAVQPQSVLQAKQWIQRIVIGTIGVEMAGTLVHVLTGSVPNH